MEPAHGYRAGALLRSCVTEKSPPSQDESAALNFEQALERLEAIVERIESGQLGLEESIAQYESGVSLIKRCKEILSRQEQRVEALARRATESAG